MTTETSQEKELSNQIPDDSVSTEQEVELTIAVLSTIRSIIDLAASRGAFKPNEMIAVGSAYKRLSTFLDNVPQQGNN